MAFLTAAVMAVMPFVWLFRGKRQIGELSPFDFAISITAGTVAGAGIADPRTQLSRNSVARVLPGMLQVGVRWLGIKLHTFLPMMNAAPMVMVEESDDFVAFMDRRGHLHIVGDHKEETGIFLY